MRRRPLAKLTRPRLHDAIRRHRLFALLDDARGRTATWISGPPGAGKTTLVASWLEDRDLPAIWYQVDAGDGDPGTFFHYLSQSVKATASLPELTPDSLAQPLALARAFFRAWYAGLPNDCVLVFDNFQESPPESPLEALAEIAAEELPEGLHIVFVSRSEPSERFARLRAARQLVEIHWHALRLTLDETRRMSEGHYSVDPPTLALLHDRCDGWAAGVTLMLERLARNGVLPDGVEAETREAVFEYFAGVMLARLGPEERHVLFSVCMLPAVDRATAQALSGVRGAGQVLEDLHRRNFFTERQAGARIVYRFHPLFRGFLETRGRDAFGEPAWLKHLQRAAEVLEEDGQVEPAFALYLAARAWDAGARLVLRQAPALTARGRGSTVRDWIGQLPDTLTLGDPWFGHWAAVGLIPTDAEKARPLLEQAYEAFLSRGDRHAAFLTVTQMLTAIVWSWHDYGSLRSWAGIMEQMLAPPPAESTPSQRVSALGFLVQAYALGSGPDARLRCHVVRLIELLESAEAGVHERLEAGAAVGKYLHFVPDLELLGRFRALIPALRNVTDDTGFKWVEWASAFAHALQRDGDLDLALVLAEEALQLHPRFSPIRRTRWLMLVKCLLLLSAGRTRDLRITFAELLAAKLKLQSPSFGADHFCLQMQSILDLDEGRVESACALAVQATQAADASGFLYIRLRSRPHLVVALAHAGRVQEALDAADEGRRLSQETVFWYADTELLMAEAYALLAGGRHEDAKQRLSSALVQAGKRRDAWDFLDFSVPFARARLYAFALQEDIETELVRAIILRYRIAPGPTAGSNWPWPLRIRTLGGFEVRVGDQPLQWGRKAPRKVMELLKVLVAGGSENVPEAAISDALWPDEDGDVAHSRYGVTLLRLRRLLGDASLLAQENGCLSLDLGRAWVDLHRLERGQDAGPDGLASLGFLPHEPDAPWLRAARARVVALAGTSRAQGATVSGLAAEKVNMK